MNNKINSYIDYLYNLDYREKPVDIDVFLESTEFLGNVTEKGRIVYPYWRNVLNDISIEDSKYIVVLTGSIGSGKTRCAVYDVCYTMYRILCLKDPWQFFHKGSVGQFAIMFFNLTKSLSKSRGYSLVQSHLCSSPWFRSHGRIVGHDENQKIEFPIFNYKLSSPQIQGFGILGEDIIIAMMDEVDNPIASEKQRIKVLKAYDAAIRRFKGRFVFDGESIGRFFLLASKQEKLSFLNTYIIGMANDPNVYIKDDSIWNVLPANTYCGDKFNVSLGDIYNPPKIIETADDVEKMSRSGFKIIQVPIEYKVDFERDMVGALRDLGGISVTHLRSSKLFSSEEVLMKCYDRFDDKKFKPCPVNKTTIPIGLKDDINLLDFIDLSEIPTPRNVPRFIHVDIAFTGDALGFGMSHVVGWTKITTTRPDGTFLINKKPVVRTDFGLRLKARPGDQIPLDKVHKLIIDLKEICGFNLRLTTFDLKIASTVSMQTLTLAGIECGSLSLDKDPQLYRGFRDLVNEGRWESRYDPYLQFELANLDDDPQKNKIDHPDKVPDIVLLKDGGTKEIVLEGSKDKSDGVVGSVMKALEMCEMPPDIEIMKKMMDTATATTITPTIDKMPKELQGLIDQPKSGVEPKQKNDKKNDQGTSKTMEIYKNILKKTME